MTVDFTLSAFFVGIYQRDKKNLAFLVDSYVPKNVMKRIYEIMVRYYGLSPIENLLESEKKELVIECRATGLFFTNQTLIESAKILHVIKFIIET